MVFIGISQQGIVRRYLVDEVGCAFRQIDIVYVDRRESVAYSAVVSAPYVAPGSRAHDSCVFRPFLICEIHVELR